MRLHHLEQVKLEVIRFRHVQKGRMIRRLPARFDKAELNVRFSELGEEAALWGAYEAGRTKY